MNFRDMDLLRSVISTLSISGHVPPFQNLENEESDGSGMSLDKLGTMF